MKKEIKHSILNAVLEWKQQSIYKKRATDISALLNAEDVWETFESDYCRVYNNSQYINNLYNNHTLQGILCYRIARSLYLQNNEEDALLISNLGRILAGFEIYYSAEIGEGLKINHGIGTVIGARTIIGKNCLIHQGVTLGDKNNKRPTIMNNVTIYAGAKILGGVVIGNNAIIAANAVVLKDVPENKKAIGIPARIID